VRLRGVAWNVMANIAGVFVIVRGGGSCLLAAG
jgi:hypothetical protein